MRCRFAPISLGLLACCLLTTPLLPARAAAAGNQAVYTDALQNNWQDWS